MPRADSGEATMRSITWRANTRRWRHVTTGGLAGNTTRSRGVPNHTDRSGAVAERRATTALGDIILAVAAVVAFFVLLTGEVPW